MGNPEQNNAATQEENVSLEEQLNKIVKSMEFDEKTNTYKLPEDIPEHLKLAAIAEKRRRDTQASLTKSRQELKKLEEANKKLQERVYSNAKINLSPEEKEALEELKFADPDAWRVKMNQLEQQAKEQIMSSLNEVMTEAEKAAELERRQILIEEFQVRNPGVKFDIEELPVKLVKQMENNEIDFEEFLEKSKKYLVKQVKVVDENPAPSNRNLNNVGGGSSTPKPSNNNIKYTNITF